MDRILQTIFWIRQSVVGPIFSNQPRERLHRNTSNNHDEDEEPGTRSSAPPVPVVNAPAIPKPADEPTQVSELWDQDLIRWDFLGDRTRAEALGAIGAALKINGFTDPQGAS